MFVYITPQFVLETPTMSQWNTNCFYFKCVVVKWLFQLQTLCSLRSSLLFTLSFQGITDSSSSKLAVGTPCVIIPHEESRGGGVESSREHAALMVRVRDAVLVRSVRFGLKELDWKNSTERTRLKELGLVAATNQTPVDYFSLKKNKQKNDHGFWTVTHADSGAGGGPPSPPSPPSPRPPALCLPSLLLLQPGRGEPGCLQRTWGQLLRICCWLLLVWFCQVSSSHSNDYI